MSKIKTAIFEALEELLEEELKEFKWRLWNSDNPIPRGKLENTKRHEVVDLMVQQYGESDAGKIAVRTLHSMKQNNLADRLKGNLQEVPDVPAGGGASSSGTAVPAQTAGVTQNISSSNGGTVKAHVLHGAVINGPVTFN